MENYDDIFSAQPQHSAQYTPDNAFNKDEWAASKQAGRTEVYEMMDAARKELPQKLCCRLPRGGRYRPRLRHILTIII